MENIMTIINYSLYGFVALLALIGMLFGLRRGLVRQSFRLITVLGALLVAFIVTTSLYPKLMESFEGKTINEIASQYGASIPENVSAWLECFDTETVAYAASLPVTVIALPFVFLVAFAATSIVFYILFVILAGVLGFLRRNRSAVSRLTGAVVGIVQGALIAGVILLPAAGIANLAGDAISTVEEKHPDSKNAAVLGDMYGQYVEPVASNPVMKISEGALGFMYDAMARVEIEGDVVEMSGVVTDAVELFTLYGDLEGADFKNLSEEHKATVDAMITVFNGDHYMTELLSGIMRAVAKAESNGTLSLGVEDEVTHDFLVSFIHVFEGSTSQTVSEDLVTTERVYFLLSDSGTLLALGDDSDGMALVNALAKIDENGKSTLGSICTELKNNVRTAPIATELNNLAMKALLTSVGVSDPNVQERVEEVKSDLNEVIAMDREDYETEEEYKEAVSDKISDTLAKNEIDITDEQLSQVSDFVIEEFENVEEISDAEIADFMAKYYDVYLNASSSGELPEGIPDELPDELPDGLPEDISEGLPS